MLKIYGASDDLIEVEGDVREEFDALATHRLVAVSNGVLLRVEYDQDGVWRIKPLAGADRVHVVQAPAGDEDNYSDVATIDEDVEWVACGGQWAARKDGRR
ncbi:hypothetical protein [Amycolatopsis thermophila]|uniref:Uncharacterized protein n=1 Tax=Amycolatopsis thermophila TaxID=206084 RepID=A0ABU0EP12_9PSEU|nr:hypothetical protein [Amycolatopsis thermophila]MDQ0376537.1 hypothetical protein [Amycolatopsis thermophila]